MSRIGRLPVPLSPDVKVNISNNEVTVEGPKGELHRSLHPDMSISLAEGALVVTRPSDERRHRALHGLTRSLLANMVEGVTKGFERNLDIVGVGYRAQKVGDKLVLQVGYSHTVEIEPPPGISFTVDRPTRITVMGIDKELVGGVAAKIRRVRPPDSYKGKGIKYAEEKLRLKAGKAAGKKK